uniref:Dihydrolipoamide dehydrogenase n=1 Tax=Toxoplasma gondii TaxID=5811 RepID=Q6S4W1_TOXGO|nr:dihydrolipoamide dehydrogenase precursor [Toxoplasma gondii]
MFFALCLGRAVGRGFLGVSPPAWRGLFAGETFGPCLRLTALLCILTTGVITLSAAFSVQRSAVVSQTFPVPLSVSTASTQPHVAFVPSPASPFSLRASLQESPGVLTPPPHYASLSSPQPRSEGVSRLFATSSSTNFSDEPFDVTIIGLGVGGHAAALHAAALGLKTAVVSGGDPGGTCVNRGCVPSKALLAAARRVKMLRNKHHLSAMGLQVRSGLVSSLASHGIALFDARGVMDGEPGRVVLERTAGSPASLPPFLRTKNVILAPGSLPFIPAGTKEEQFSVRRVTFDDAQHQVMTSDTCVSLPWLPSEICIVGSGYIGLEFMDVFTSLGSEVVMVEAGPRLLPGVDKEVAKLAERLLLQQFKERPVKLYTNTLASQVRPLGPKGEAPVEVQLTDAQTKESKGKIYPDACLIATGRRPNTEGLGLDSLGVTLKRGGFIPVDACMRVLKHAPEGDEKPEVIRGVYCVGDANGQMMLAHAASAQAVAAVETIAGRPRTVNVKHIPAACFTSPEIAFIGKVNNVTVNSKDSPLVSTPGILKVLYRKDTGKILGCHMIGIHASDLIQECATAITNDISVKDLAFTVHTHPTLSEVVDAAWKKAVGMNAH